MEESVAVKDQLVRMNYDLDRDLHSRLMSVLPHGMRMHMLRVLTRMIVEAVEKAGERGPLVMGAILSGEYKIVYEAIEKESSHEDGKHHKVIHQSPAGGSIPESRLDP